MRTVNTSKGGWMSLTFWQWLIICGCFIPILLVVFAIMEQGQRLPFFDDWGSAYSMALKTLEGYLSINDLFAFHNEHPILFTRLSVIFSTLLTRWDLTALLSVSIVLGVCIAVMLVRLVALEFGNLVAWVCALPIFWFIFTLRARHDWTIAFQNAFLFVMMFFVLAVLVLRSFKVGWGALFFASFCAFCATFSLGNGIFTPAILTLVLIACGYKRLVHYIAWFILAGIITALYLHFAPAIISQPRSIPLASVPANLGQLLEFFFLSLGSPLAIFNYNLGTYSTYRTGLMLVGISGFALCCVNILVAARTWYRQQYRKGVLSHGGIWIALAGFSFITLAAGSYSRFLYFSGARFEPLSERGVLNATLFWVTTIVLVIFNLYQWTVQSQLQQTKEVRAQDNEINVQNSRKERLRLGSLIGIPLNAVGLTSIGALCLGAITFTPSQLQIYRNQYEACFHRYVYFRLPLSCTYAQEIADRIIPGLEYIANNSLTIYASQTLDISLLINLSPELVGTPAIPYQYTSYQYNSGESVPSLFQHPPQVIRYTTHLPTSHRYAEFRSDIYITDENLSSAAQDGALFVVRVLDENGNVLSQQDSLFDPNIDRFPLPISLDLTSYIGQTFILELETEIRETSVYDWAQWVNPRLHFWR